MSTNHPDEIQQKHPIETSNSCSSSDKSFQEHEEPSQPSSTAPGSGSCNGIGDLDVQVTASNINAIRDAIARECPVCRVPRVDILSGYGMCKCETVCCRSCIGLVLHNTLKLPNPDSFIPIRGPGAHQRASSLSFDRWAVSPHALLAGHGRDSEYPIVSRHRESDTGPDRQGEDENTTRQNAEKCVGSGAQAENQSAPRVHDPEINAFHLISKALERAGKMSPGTVDASVSAWESAIPQHILVEWDAIRSTCPMCRCPISLGRVDDMFKLTHAPNLLAALAPFVDPSIYESSGVVLTRNGASRGRPAPSGSSPGASVVSASHSENTRKRKQVPMADSHPSPPAVRFKCMHDACESVPLTTRKAAVRHAARCLAKHVQVLPLGARARSSGTQARAEPEQRGLLATCPSQNCGRTFCVPRPDNGGGEFAGSIGYAEAWAKSMSDGYRAHLANFECTSLIACPVPGCRTHATPRALLSHLVRAHKREWFDAAKQLEEEASSPQESNRWSRLFSAIVRFSPMQPNDALAHQPPLAHGTSPLYQGGRSAHPPRTVRGDFNETRRSNLYYSPSDSGSDNSGDTFRFTSSNSIHSIAREYDYNDACDFEYSESDQESIDYNDADVFECGESEQESIDYGTFENSYAENLRPRGTYGRRGSYEFRGSVSRRGSLGGQCPELDSRHVLEVGSGESLAVWVDPRAPRDSVAKWVKDNLAPQTVCGIESGHLSLSLRANTQQQHPYSPTWVLWEYTITGSQFHALG